MSEEKLTREQIEQFRRVAKKYLQGIRVDEVCNLALQSLSQEAVRDEALEEAARECGICASRQAIKHDQKVRDQTRRDLAAAIRALKREPNAAAQASGSSEHTLVSANPAPAAPDVQQPLQPVDPNRLHAGWNIKGEPVYLDEPLAPDVAEMVEQLHAIAQDWQDHFHDTKSAGYWVPMKAAALLAKLGQGWVPQGIPIGQCCCRAHHPNYGRCLQCPIHGTATARSLR